MDSLKATMALALAGDPVEGGWCFDLTDEEYSDPHAHNMRMDFLRQADAAISTFEAMLLSDEVVEAAAEAIRSTADAFFSGREVEQITSVKSAKQAFDRLYRQQARAALQAALAAAKGTEGSE